jgi:hypothetical protein
VLECKELSIASDLGSDRGWQQGDEQARVLMRRSEPWFKICCNCAYCLKSSANEAPQPREVVRALSQGACDAGCNITLPT